MQAFCRILTWKEAVANSVMCLIRLLVDPVTFFYDSRKILNNTGPKWLWFFWKAKMFCFDLFNKRSLMHRVYQESTCGASAIETDRVVWNLSLECNFVQAASEKSFIRFINIFENLRRNQWLWVTKDSKIPDLIRTTCNTARRKFRDNIW